MKQINNFVYFTQQSFRIIFLVRVQYHSQFTMKYEIELTKLLVNYF